MTLRNSAIALLLCYSACTSVRPQVTLEPGASLKDYQVFVVRPVTDETGARFNLNVTDTLRRQIADRLRSHHLAVVTDDPASPAGPALVIASALVGFRGMPILLQLPGPGITECRIESELRDGQTGRRVGRVVAAVLEERTRPMTVLNECAHDIGDAIAGELRRGRVKKG
jgi:hypothetical protein